MNKQEIFNKVATHLLKQNRKSIHNSGNCAYRGQDGTACAIGCLIPDEFDPQKLEGISLSAARDMFNANTDDTRISRRLVKALNTILDCDVLQPDPGAFLCELQRIHDGCPPRIWKNELAWLAGREGLTMVTVPEEDA